MLFQWLRTSVKNAVLGGIADALSEIGDAPADAGHVLTQLRQRLAVALPAPAPAGTPTAAAPTDPSTAPLASVPGKASGVAQDEPAPAVAPAAAPHRNGRRRAAPATA